MPVYEYSCSECEHYFTELKTISNYQSPSYCPVCSSVGKKIISAPSLNIMRQEMRKAHQTNEKSAHEPKVKHTCGSHCHHHKQEKKQPDYKQQINKRPWMIGH
jgi:putative FmdB family regulatory protein